MTAEEFARRLAKARGRNGQWEACCPAHEDSAPSLSIGTGKEGRLLLHCHAGCTTEDILGAMGLTMDALFPEESSHRGKDASQNGNGKQEIAATYDYTDAQGTLLFQVVRFLPKDFRQRRPAPQGGWFWNLGETPRVLFRLPAILDAIAAGRTIYIAEGEKDALTLIGWGLDATTCPGGAGKWRPEYTASLHGAKAVIILADNDPTGLSHASQVQTLLAQSGIRAFLAPPFPSAKDVTEWAVQGHGAEAFADHIADLQEDILPEAVCAADIVPRPIDWLVKDFLLAREYAVLGAEGGKFKTTTMLAIAAAIAGGYLVLGGFDAADPRPVLIVSEEDPEEVLRNRLDAMIRGNDWDAQQVLRRIHIIALKACRITEPRWQMHIQEQAKKHQCCMICFDPLADLLDGENAEKDNEVARPVIRWFRKLGRLGFTPLVVAHYGKQNEARSGQSRIRGASAWNAGARAIYYTEERDQCLWLGCDKLSRCKKPDAREMTLEVVSEAANAAMWVSATVKLSHPPASGWALHNQRDLSPAEFKALKVLSRTPDESLSWSRWLDISETKKSAFSEAIHRLGELGYLARERAGSRAGKPVFHYRITPEGLSHVLAGGTNSPTPVRLRSDSGGVGPTPTPRLRSPFRGADSPEWLEDDPGPDPNSAPEWDAD